MTVFPSGVSLPTWERGLKSEDWEGSYTMKDVAPYMGAWIEMAYRNTFQRFLDVAPYMGAWIEILRRLNQHPI